MIGLIGIKEGMSRVFTEDGNSVPVTVVKIDSNVVTQIKKIDSEGYSSVQISTGTKKEKHLTKPEKAFSGFVRCFSFLVPVDICTDE